MGGRASRRKGHDFERWLVRRLRASALFDEVKRGYQARGGQEFPDVSADGLWIECKRGKRPNIRAALRQAEDEAAAGYMPVAVTKADREQPIVSMLLEDWLEMLGDVE